MTVIPILFETLPNELLMNIFQYFDARDLFRAFHNLNCRFNRLLRSLRYVCFTLIKFDSNESNDYHIFAPYIYNLVIDHAVNIDLSRFANLHRLTLLSPTSNQLKQVVSNSLDYLEYLSIGYEHFLFSYYIPDLCEKIFSNGFPRLTSCCLFEPRILEIIPKFTQATQLCILKMDNVDLLAYKYILSLCPNLNLFEFTMLNQQDDLINIEPHRNLKKMSIKFPSLMKSFSDCAMNCYLSCVPNLEQLNVCEINFDVTIMVYLNSNWFASLIKKHLPSLRRYKYYIHACGVKQNDENTLNSIKTNFKQIHNQRYQSVLVIKLSHSSLSTD
ncbi:unnamed protein product [Rotaria socialis]|uniref:F-box domain-containing protein n=1 Tax=Rotaria socialis TaxID=392032 RepID=A0A818A3H0_9BILA|nr:unnamed protein product [Rotaria socialis]CAF3426517.1 unnamed protein product [Rotaria socialis]CAF3529232.1 unnamed protein product [Rotaria socialis]CAF3777748.1 unnamed protein product [Rotaria socialis]CAF4288928.1 unnamed protein product [Rotaria socialis]